MIINIIVAYHYRDHQRYHHCQHQSSSSSSSPTIEFCYCCSLPKIRVIAYASVSPLVQGTATVAVTVRRDEDRPVFAQGYLDVTMSADAVLGSLVAQVNATPADGSVSLPRLFSMMNSEKLTQLSKLL